MPFEASLDLFYLHDVEWRSRRSSGASFAFVPNAPTLGSAHRPNHWKAVARSALNHSCFCPTVSMVRFKAFFARCNRTSSVFVFSFMTPASS